MFIDVKLNGLRHLLARARAALAGEPDPTGSDGVPAGELPSDGHFPWDAYDQLSDTPGSWLAAKAAPS